MASLRPSTHLSWCLPDRIFGAAQGAFATTVSADHRMCLPVPHGMSWEQAAGLYITYPTSAEALIGRAEAKAGDWVLVHAGAGA
jgi:NADPH:quinone reductase-like Zn-dependent oxidoreductase